MKTNLRRTKDVLFILISWTNIMNRLMDAASYSLTAEALGSWVGIAVCLVLIHLEVGDLFDRS